MGFPVEFVRPIEEPTRTPPRCRSLADSRGLSV